MRTADIRKRFLDYFERNDHRVVASSPLVPGNDPTLLFTNAGMVQFKDVFLGLEKRDYKRAVTAQRCVRAGGKHNDLENVGYTARHHTFFEMLGNFSFGDYFKREAIHYAWDFLTREIGLPAERLWATVFEEDDEAASIWLDEIGIPAARFARIGAKDNFWAMGDTGPCGPCTEIFYDHGPSVAGGPPGTAEADGDRYIEIWNLVFMQFNRRADGVMEPLPKPSVDTGMGLERLAAVLQGVHSNYEIDLFRHLIEAAAEAVGTVDLESHSLRVIADHIRSTSFLITDGVIPSNEGRGYVLRRIIRRAVRHGFRLGAAEPFLYRLVPPLVEEMGDACPELREAAGRVSRTLREEEQRFAATLEQGLRILAAEMERLGGSVIPGALAFKLYDTFGFPVDLTADVARERGMTIDLAGFEHAMEEQRGRARAASRFVMGERRELPVTTATEFTGYRGLESEGRVLLLLAGDDRVDEAKAGDDVTVILDRTPFYAESGGQVGDRGRLRSGDAVIEVRDTSYFPNRVVGHHGRVRMGTIRVGDRVQAEVDARHRADTANNHSATHLLHEALKRVLGDHVQQKGSLVAPDRLRFDFSHSGPLTVDELRRVEETVNAEIRANHAVRTEVMALDAARKAGAAALFGEKYDERVRVVGMGGFSLELCGGTHVAGTGQIGVFKIVQETGVAAGIRRIEALTGRGALEFINARLAFVDGACRALKCGPDELEAKVAQQMRRIRELERALETLQTRAAPAGGDPLTEAREIAGVKVLAVRRDGLAPGSLRAIMDQLRDRLGSAVVVVGGVHEGKAHLVAGVSGDLAGRLRAGDLIRDLVPRVGGKGGGKPQMAQGGGPDTAALDETLDQVCPWVRNVLE